MTAMFLPALFDSQESEDPDSESASVGSAGDGSATLQTPLSIADTVGYKKATHIQHHIRHQHATFITRIP